MYEVTFDVVSGGYKIPVTRFCNTEEEAKAAIDNLKELDIYKNISYKKKGDKND